MKFFLNLLLNLPLLIESSCKSARLLQVPQGELVIGLTLPEDLLVISPLLVLRLTPPPVLPVLPLVEIEDARQFPPLPVLVLEVRETVGER